MSVNYFLFALPIPKVNNIHIKKNKPNMSRAIVQPEQISTTSTHIHTANLALCNPCQYISLPLLLKYSLYSANAEVKIIGKKLVIPRSSVPGYYFWLHLTLMKKNKINNLSAVCLRHAFLELYKFSLRYNEMTRPFH
uniref:Uncharacterized protein n=1 Tax=Sphaerodactylus townsendi TaxID=933632 RepID=A0ACB8EKS3_9SAUR